MSFLQKHIQDFTDEKLVKKYQATDDQEYLSVLYQRYMHLVYGVCLKYLKDRDLAQDASLDIYEKLVQEIHRRDIAQFRPWLYVLTKNHCLMYLRKTKNVHSVAYDGEESAYFFMEIPDEAHLTYEKTMQKEADLTQLEQCIEQLKHDQKRCVKLFYLEEKSYVEIHESLQLELKKIKSYIQNGKRNLLICMEKGKGKLNSDV